MAFSTPHRHRLRALVPVALASALPAVAAPEPDRVATRLLAEASLAQGAWKKLEYLTDRIGHRLSGSAAAAAAVEWGLAELRRDRLENVRGEPVWVTHWVRGAERFEITAPIRRPLAGLGLGNSVGTPEGGVWGHVVEVASFEELHARGAEVPGAIVFFNKQIRANGGPTDGYGAGGKLRWGGPAEARKLGAAGMIIRSLGTGFLRLPHTGSTGYEDGVEPIPGAAIAAEDADLLHRLLARGERVEVCLEMSARRHSPALSANVVGELTGRERPQEIVLIGAHLDSWDVGQGAVDDGAGVAVVLEAMRLLRELDLRPRRTVRAVLFMNEENGLGGGLGYRAGHESEAERHVAAIESDAGAGRPLGFTLDGGAGARERLEELLRPLSGLGCHRVVEGGTGADISPLEAWGTPRLGLQQDMTRYFDWHHTEADTLDKVDPRELVENVAAMAYAAWALAEAPDRLAPTRRPRQSGR